MWWLKKKEKGGEVGEEQTTRVEVEKTREEAPAVKAKDEKNIVVKPEIVGKGVLLEWFKNKLGESEFQEAAKYLSSLTLQFQVGGIPFYISKAGVGPLMIKEGRAVSFDALITIPTELEEKLASSDSVASFLENYKEHLKKAPRIKVQLIRSLEELEKRGVMRSKLIRSLLDI